MDLLFHYSLSFHFPALVVWEKRNRALRVESLKEDTVYHRLFIS